MLSSVLYWDAPWLYGAKDLEDPDGPIMSCKLCLACEAGCSKHFFPVENYKHFLYYASRSKGWQLVIRRIICCMKRALSTMALTWTVRYRLEPASWQLRFGLSHTLFAIHRFGRFQKRFLHYSERLDLVLPVRSVDKRPASSVSSSSVILGYCSWHNTRFIPHNSCH